MTSQNVANTNQDTRTFAFLPIPYLQVLLGSTLISFSAVFSRLSVVSPTAEVFYRMFFGGVILLGVTLWQRHRLWAGAGHFTLLACASLAMAIELTCWHKAIAILGPGLATILGNLQVILLAIVGIVFFKERVKPLFYFALALACVGLYCLIGVKWPGAGTDFHHGVFFGLITACLYATFVVILRQCQRIPNNLHALPTLTVITIVCMSMSALAMLLSHDTFAIPDGYNFTWLLLYGVIGQAIGWLLITYGIPKVNVAIAGFFILMQPSLSFLWDIIFFHHLTPPLELLGVAITLTAICLSIKSTQVSQSG